MEPKKFSGILSEDSPKLLGELKRSLNSQDVEHIAKAYKERAALFPIEESGLTRTIGANYNPPAARIAFLLLADGNCRDIETIAAALYMDTALVAIQGAKPEFANHATCIRIKENVQSLKDEPDPLTLAVLLDEIRHMHMRIEDEEGKKTRLKTVEKYLRENPSKNTLYPKCLQALELQMRRA